MGLFSIFLAGAVATRRDSETPCPKVHMLARPLLLQNGAPRPMKMGTIVSPWRYDVATAEAIRPDNLRRTAILRYASWAAVFRMSRVVRLPFDGSSHFDQSRVRPDGPFQASQSHSRNRAIGFGPW
jgi:hypothetical protein